MNAIIIIFIVIGLISVFGSAIKNLSKKFFDLFAGLLLLSAIVNYPKQALGIFAIIVVILIIQSIAIHLKNKRIAKNTKELRAFLDKNCATLGKIENSILVNKTIQFKNLEYSTDNGYDKILDKFLLDTLQNYVFKVKQEEWIHLLCGKLDEYGMVKLDELPKLLTPVFKYTHTVSSIKVAKRFADNKILVLVDDNNEKAFEQVKLDPIDGIEQVGYKYTTEFALSQGKQMETEEISFDDL